MITTQIQEGVSPAPDQRTVVTPKEAADYLGISTSTLSKYRSAGTGPVFLRLKRAVKYRLKDLDDYLDACQVRPQNLGDGNNE